MGESIAPRPRGSTESISIVIPVYNEAESIVALVDEIINRLGAEIKYEIIVVDDGSSDDGIERLLQLRNETAAALRLISHHENLGQSTALRTGTKAATSDWIVTMDGDGQNDPADIFELLRALTDAPNQTLLIAGHRRQRKDAWLRRVSARIANGVRRRLLNDATPDTGCGLKLINRRAFLDLPFFDHMHRFLPALILRDGGKVVSVVVNHRPRTRGHSKYGVWNRLWVGIVDLLGVIWLQRRGKIVQSREVP